MVRLRPLASETAGPLSPYESGPLLNLETCPPEGRLVRHTAATLWLQSGVDLKAVQAWLGHSTAKLTADTYSHYMGSDADTASIARMNAVLRAAPQRPPGR